jgi:uncharacterized SAM-binding protein YcdF (DUF218 family)
LKRLLIRSALILAPLLILSLFALSRLGAWLVVEDPLVKADAIVVLGGSMYERPLEAVDLYRAGMAPRIYLFREIADEGERELIARGITLMRAVDVQVDAMVKVGVPREAIHILNEANSTADESQQVLDLVTRERMARVILVTSKQHTRRARLVMNRRIAPTGAQVIMRSSRYDHSDVERWWAHRSTLRFTLFESQRLFGYWIGVAD